MPGRPFFFLAPLCKGMVGVDWWLTILLFGISLIGPWTVPVYRLFGLCEFEQVSVVDMSVYMAKKVPLTFGRGFVPFVLVPVCFIVLRSVSSRAANILQACIAVVCEVASIITLPLFWIPSGGSASNVMGDVLVVDLVTMYIIHGLLIFGARALPPWSLACGPLFGLTRYIRTNADTRPSSLLGGVLALYANVGGLYRAYNVLHDEFGLDVFTQTVGYHEWRGYEMYAAVNVVGGFVLICSSIPPAFNLKTWRGFGNLFELILYVILLNANVAAAWIASRGVLRAPLVAAKPFVWRQNEDPPTEQGQPTENVAATYTRRLRHTSRDNLRA